MNELKTLVNWHIKEKFYDICLKVDGQLIWAPKKVLTTKSLFFNNLFALLPTLTEFTIRDTSFQAMQSTIHFLCSDEEVDFNDGQNFVAMYRLSMRYGIPDLSATLSLRLMSNLTMENALATLVLATEEKDVQLAIKVVGFAKRYGRADELLNAYSMLEYLKKNPSLASVVMNRLQR
ncbi:hypothetical protein M3Y98_00002000 [Aphelenchoides besseyi]|nr:hypothetical protein M3Y98_00002000 [Aphelenchoides besseyi]KAI6198444.1 hypothetical protein M3Y96_00519900 [Aphelenchoides besseyi]